MNNLIIKNISDIEEISDEIAFVINEKLNLGKRVLLFTTGGSSIPMQILVSKKISNVLEDKLVVTLTDERYGKDDHSDSNWFKLISGGFVSSGVKMVPILCNKNIEETTDLFIQNLEKELNEADYKIGMFGIGADAHTSGILPYSVAVNSNELACYYDAPPFLRITITPKTILQLDEAFVYAMGESKWPVVESLKEDMAIIDKPAQILKKVPLLTVYTDRKDI
jgi:6-phosphogluconolactonase/glucosamine-6-phosphate isomerase/deaminase